MLFPSLLLLASSWQMVIADSDSCSSSATISSQSDADTYAGCDQIDGSVTISSSATGSIIIYNVTQIKGSFTADSASGLTTLSLPGLEKLQGALTIDKNDSLNNLSMNALTEVSSGITISGNTKLQQVEFKDLEQVGGTLQLTGSFSSVSLPAIDQVKGQTTIRGGNSMSCTVLNNLENVFQGGYSCSASGGSSLSTGAKAGIAVAVIIVVLLLLFVMWWIIRQRRARRQRRRDSKTPATLPPPILKEEKQIQTQYQSVPTSDSSPTVPRKPVGPPPAMLDGRSIYEAAYPVSPIPVYHELDAGPVFSTHQRPINSED